MNKKICGLILCLMGSMQSQAMFQGFFSTFTSLPVTLGSYIKNFKELSINSTNTPSNKLNGFLAKPMNNTAETISTVKPKRLSDVDLAKNRTKKEHQYKNNPNPALNELLAYDAKYGHKAYWQDLNNTGQTKLYEQASNASSLKPQVKIDFSKVDLLACSKGSKIEKFKDQSKATFAFPDIEKFAVRPAFNPEKTFDASVYTDETRPCAQAENCA